jgi:hypothetical protein
MFTSASKELRLAVSEFAKYERSCADQALILRNLQVTAVRERQSAVLRDPEGRVLAYATPSGAISLVGPVAAEPGARAANEPALAPEDGFYATTACTYYVAGGKVYELRSPELPPFGGFRRIDRLPSGAAAIDVDDFDPEAPADAALFAYADAIDRITEVLTAQ